MTATVTCKRIEIIADAPLVPRIVALIKAVGISGWSVTQVHAGEGRHGTWQDDDISGAASKAILLSIASEDKAAALVERLTPLLDSHGMLLTTCDVQVVRPSRY